MSPNPSRSVRLFVMNVPLRSAEPELRRHFEAAVGPGDVLSVSLRGSFASVRMRDEAAAERARQELHKRPFRGSRLAVHRFRGIKIFVGGFPAECTQDEIRALFEDFGPVAECDIVKGYAFVHMDNKEDGKAAIEHLHGTEIKGRTISVQLSVRDRKRILDEQHEERNPRFQKDTFPDASYRDYPPESFEEDYRAQPTSGQAAAYRNGAQSEPNRRPAASSGWAYSPQSHSYGERDGPKAFYGNEAAYGPRGDAAAAYSTRFSDSLSTHDGVSVEMAYLPASDPLATRPQTSSRHSLYERIRLSPPRITNKDLYGEDYAINKRYTTKQTDDSYCPPYEHIRLSPPRGSRDDFDRQGNAPSKRYTARSESATRHRPYERAYLSPTRRSHENRRSYH